MSEDILRLLRDWGFLIVRVDGDEITVKAPPTRELE